MNLAVALQATEDRMRNASHQRRLNLNRRYATEIVSRLASRGIGHIYVDGGITIQRFLRAGLIHRLIITRVPVLIGAGIPLFGDVPVDFALTHVATRQYVSGLVQSEYVVAA